MYRRGTAGVYRCVFVSSTAWNRLWDIARIGNVLFFAVWRQDSAYVDVVLASGGLLGRISPTANDPVRPIRRYLSVQSSGCILATSFATATRARCPTQAVVLLCACTDVRIHCLGLNVRACCASRSAFVWLPATLMLRSCPLVPSRSRCARRRDDRRRPACLVGSRRHVAPSR